MRPCKELLWGLVPASEPCSPQPCLRLPQAEIFQAFTELFQVACAKPPPLGLCDYPSSRAVYAIDLMLKWDNRPDGEGAPSPHNPNHAPLHLPKADYPAFPHPPRGQRGHFRFLALLSAA